MSFIALIHILATVPIDISRNHLTGCTCQVIATWTEHAVACSFIARKPLDCLNRADPFICIRYKQETNIVLGGSDPKHVRVCDLLVNSCCLFNVALLTFGRGIYFSLLWLYLLTYYQLT